MTKRYAIFDMDGTLVDSMKQWQNLVPEYLEKIGIECIPQALAQELRDLSMLDATKLLIARYGLRSTPTDILSALYTIMNQHYLMDVTLKPGILGYLQTLSEHGTSMCVASATPLYMVENCLKHLGIRHYFQFILSCKDLGCGKDKPDIYHLAAQKLAAPPAEIAVFEDALYAAQTVKQAGYYLIGVYDQSSDCDWPTLKAISDETITHWDTAAL